MKHLHFVQSADVIEGGGLARAALELSDAMQLAGLHSSVVATRGRPNSHISGVEQFRRIPPHAFFFSPKLLVKSRKLVENVDVVHGHGFYMGTNMLVGGASRKAGIPLVYHAHGILEPWILARSKWKKKLVHLLFENANFRYATLWRALTEKEASQIRAIGIKAPITVCPNGIDLNWFSELNNVRLRLRNGPKILLFLARIHPKKGIDLLLNAWSRIDRNRRADWRIVIAGPDELGYLSECKALCENLDLNESVTFVGPVDGLRKLEILASASAFILPSRSEGFSVAILEALASRLPVIGTFACNFPQLASVGGGWLSDSTVEGIFNSLENLVSADDSELAQRAELGRRLVEQHYQWSSIVCNLEDACKAYCQ